jgi:5-methylcytosine-specific restriction endonuclease McrA
MYHVESNGQLVMMTKDHIIPSSKGGADTQDNLQTMCNHCNSKKSDFSFDDFLKNGCKDMRKLHSIQQCV